MSSVDDNNNHIMEEVQGHNSHVFRRNNTKSRIPIRTQNQTTNKVFADRENHEHIQGTEIYNSILMPKSSCAANFTISAMVLPAPATRETKRDSQPLICSNNIGQPTKQPAGEEACPVYGDKQEDDVINNNAITDGPMEERHEVEQRSPGVIYDLVPLTLQRESCESPEADANLRRMQNDVETPTPRSHFNTQERVRSMVPVDHNVERMNQFRVAPDQQKIDDNNANHSGSYLTEYRMRQRQEQTRNECTRIASYRPIQEAVLPRNKTKIPGPKDNTYEGIFYKLKAISDKGSGSVRCKPMIANNGEPCPNNGSHYYAHAQQRSVRTKIVTETEFEYEDKHKASNSPIPMRDTSRSAKERSKNRRTPAKNPPKIRSSSHQSSNKNGDNKRRRSNIPKMILPAATDSYTLISDSGQENAKNRDDDGESCSEERKLKSKKREKMKRETEELHTTLRYLIQVLVKKDDEIQHLKCSKANHTGSPLNNENTEPSALSGSGEHPRVLPFLKFDMEEFIRKYFKGLLFTNQFKNSSFTALQMFHLAISTRDCMAQVIKDKMKNAEHVLKKRYDTLLSLQESSAEPLDASLYMEVLDSYRRFMRYIYCYFKESIQHVENFEQKILSQPPCEEPKSRTVYSKEQVVTIDGERYTAVVIPIHKLPPVNAG